MNELRKFVAILANNKIQNHTDFEPIRGDINGYLYIKNLRSGEYFKLSLNGDEKIQKVTENIAHNTPENVKIEYTPKEEPIYKSIEVHDVMSQITIDKYNTIKEEELEQQEILDDINSKIDNTDMNTIPKIDIDIDPNRIQKEFEELKKKQEQEIKEKLTVKKNINKYSDRNYPSGWNLMTEFVDVEGNVFHKGVEQEHLKGTRPQTIIKTKPKNKKE